MKKKNYTLYVKIYNSRISILQGTLKEIDDFTSSFESSNAILRNIVKNYDEKLSSTIELKSSRGNDYDVLYFKQRPIIFEENSKLVINYLNSLNKDELISFLKKNTKILKYINKDENLSKVPLYNLYMSVLNGTSSNILYELKNYVNLDYNNYRQLIIGIMNENEEVPFVKVRKIDRDKVSDMISTIRHNSKIDFNDFILKEKIENKKEENSYIDDNIWNILNNDEMDIDDKMNELDFLLNDEDNYRKCVEQNMALIYKV